MILGHGKTTAKELKPLVHMVRGEGWTIFLQWCKEYGIEISLEAVRGKEDTDATGKVFVLDELNGFREDVEQRFQNLKHNEE